MDQAENLRNLVKGTVSRARFLSVTSGKGGVGKTNFAVNLAVLLNEFGKKVILVDVDIALANADILLSVQPRFNLGHVLAGEVSVLEALTRTPSGILVMPGCAGVRHLSDLDAKEREFLKGSFQELEAYADFVIIDTGAGISKNVVQFAATSDEVVVVTIPEPTAITDGYAVIKAVSREKGSGRIRLIVNQSLGAADARRVSERIRMVSRRFLGIEVDDLGFVQADPRVGQAVRRKRPFVLEFPRCPASKCMREIAERIVGGNTTPSRGLFRKVTRAVGGLLG